MDNASQYRTYGPRITSRDDFYREIDACIDYCSGERFVVPHFASYFANSLRAIQAWCADGRHPQYPERRTIRMGWVIGREIDDAGVPRVGEWADMAARIIAVGNYFANWPSDQQIADDVEFWPMAIMTNPRVPALAEVAAGVERVEGELRAAGCWTDRPIEQSKLASKAAFGSDTMTPAEWLQFVFVPRVRDSLAGLQPLPTGSALTMLGARTAPQRELWPVMYALSDFDQLFITPKFPDNVRRAPGSRSSR